MQGDQKVIDQLNTALCGELNAIVQYMVQAETCENWGYGRLAALTKARAIQEMHHAEALIERIIFLDAAPQINIPLKPTIGSDVTEQLEAGLLDETHAIGEYNQASAICREAGDNGSKELFDRLLADEEKHADFLDAQLNAIKQMGIGPYLAQQMEK